jgi:hypothetical protein
MLLHILCNFTKEKAKSFNKITYIRLLGFNENGRKYLNYIKKNIPVPIISKINREKDLMLEFELQTTNIYALTTNNDLIKQEYINHLNKKGE